MGEACDQRLGVPVAEGSMVDQAFADRGPTGGLYEVGFRLVSSMKTSLSSMFAMSDWRVSTQTLRRSATLGRRISLASSVFLWLRPKNDHIVHKARRHPKVPGRLTMTVPLFNERYHAASQLDRMWLAHSDPPYLPGS
jgi:hypothetical protein